MTLVRLAFLCHDEFTTDHARARRYRKDGSRVAKNLTQRGLGARTAARGGADIRFDWDDKTTHGPALSGVDSVYLVAPVTRVDFAGQVSDFLDLAQAPEYGMSPT
jgi:hypothetical protein